MYKICPKCKVAKEPGYFYKMKASGDGLQSECIACRKDRQANRGEAGKRKAAIYYERTKEHQERLRKKRVYNLTQEEYEALLNEQNGKCALESVGGCSGTLCIDHNHDTGKIRGLLCRVHNKALGIFGDSVEGLEEAIRYLR